MTTSSHVAVIALPYTSHVACSHKLVLRLARASPATHFTFLAVNSSLFNSPPELANFTPHDIEDCVPPGESPSDLSFELFYRSLLRPRSVKDYLKAAEVAVGGAKITCLLVDGMLSAVFANVAEEIGVPWVALWPPSPPVLSVYMYTDLIRQRCAEAASADGDAKAAQLALDFVPGLDDARVSDILRVNIFHGEINPESRFLEDLAKLGQALPRASAVVLSSFRELNRDEFNSDMEANLQAVLNVGFFSVSSPVMSVSSPVMESSDDDSTGCLAWLDGRKPNSVAYISFGTEAEFSEDELKIMAEALEETGTSFLWSLRSKQQALLPSGFVERTRQTGRLVAWTNQPRVLAHGSVGANVTHCGTNSVNESIMFGVPIIYGKAFGPDNQMHSRLVERDWGMGVRVSEAGDLTKHGLVRALEMVLKREEGKKMKERALAMKRLTVYASSPGGSGAKDFIALLRLLSPTTV